MGEERTVLGKGLSALIPNAASGKDNYWGPTIQTASDEQIVSVPAVAVKPNPFQPRSHFDDTKLDELAQSISDHGIIQPLIVTRLDSGTYQLIAGERRLKAAQKIGLSHVPVVVRKAEDQKKLELSLIENVQRQNLNPLEEAVSYKRLMDEFNLTQEEVARQVGKSRSSIANFVRLLTLPKPILEEIEKGAITFSHAKVILSYQTGKEQLTALKRILKGNLTVAEAAKPSQRPRGHLSASDPVLAAWEQKLSGALGFETRITKKSRGGAIEIAYSSEEDLKTLLDRLLREG